MLCIFFLCYKVCAARRVVSFSGAIGFFLSCSATCRCVKLSSPIQVSLWSEDQLSEVEDCRLGPTASTVEVLPAPCASSLW